MLSPLALSQPVVHPVDVTQLVGHIHRIHFAVAVIVDIQVEMLNLHQSRCSWCHAFLDQTKSHQQGVYEGMSNHGLCQKVFLKSGQTSFLG